MEKRNEMSYKESTFVVDLAKKSCGCRVWDVSGIPCVHALAAIHKNNWKKEYFIHTFLLKDTYEVSSICHFPSIRC